jgi:hypothetical protein
MDGRVACCGQQEVVGLKSRITRSIEHLKRIIGAGATVKSQQQPADERRAMHYRDTMLRIAHFEKKKN